jgi:hypothetical protein
LSRLDDALDATLKPRERYVVDRATARAEDDVLRHREANRSVSARVSVFIEARALKKLKIALVGRVEALAA